MNQALRRGSEATFLMLVIAVFIAMLAWAPAGRGTVGLPAEARGGGHEVNPEAEEQLEEAEEHREHFEEAVREGKAGTASAVNAAPAPGWAGEMLVDASADDWEPAIAADPNAPYVYFLTTRYGSTKPCAGNCPTPYMALYISSDNGATWSAGAPLCACKGSGQFDPIIEVVPNTGAVYALYMNGFNVVFMKSVNHGATWSAPVKTYGNVSWNDKPVIAVSNDGKDVYVSFNGPTGGDPYVAQSHDFGATWTQRKLVDSNRYYFAFDADVAADGTVYFAESSILYGGGGNKGTTPSAAIDEHVFVSTDNGATFTDRLVASVQPGLACVADGCPPDFYLGHNALTVDATGRVVLVYDGAATTGGLQTIRAQSSTNKGASWSAAVTLSAAGEEATAPAIESTGGGDVRAWYYQTTGANPDVWNVYLRTSTNGGSTWSAPVRLSDASSGASYKSAAGFLEMYGDYGQLAITSAGKTIAIWGEGTSYTGPGGVWINRQP
jgi:BNR/Asp-box repeat